MTSDDRTVHQRIVDAYKVVQASEFVKSKFVETGGTDKRGKPKGYKVIEIAQILEVIREAHSTNGIFVVFGQVRYDESQGEGRSHSVKESNYGNKTEWFHAHAHVDVMIYGANGDYIETTVSCEAKDNSDKLTNKLITNAQRSLYRVLYAIDALDDADDPEETNVHKDPEPTEEEKANRRKQMAEDAKGDAFFGPKSASDVKGGGQ